MLKTRRLRYTWGATHYNLTSAHKLGSDVDDLLYNKSLKLHFCFCVVSLFSGVKCCIHYFKLKNDVVSWNPNIDSVSNSVVDKQTNVLIVPVIDNNESVCKILDLCEVFSLSPSCIVVNRTNWLESLRDLILHLLNLRQHLLNWRRRLLSWRQHLLNLRRTRGIRKIILLHSFCSVDYSSFETQNFVLTFFFSTRCAFFHFLFESSNRVFICTIPICNLDVFGCWTLRNLFIALGILKVCCCVSMAGTRKTNIFNKLFGIFCCGSYIGLCSWGRLPLSYYIRHYPNRSRLGFLLFAAQKSVVSN